MSNKATDSAPNPSIEVTFKQVLNDDLYDHEALPITVEVGESLFHQQGGNLDEMSDEDVAAFNNFIQTVGVVEALEMAEEIVGSAPQYDGVSLSESVHPDSVAGFVEYKNIR